MKWQILYMKGQYMYTHILYMYVFIGTHTHKRFEGESQIIWWPQPSQNRQPINDLFLSTENVHLPKEYCTSCILKDECCNLPWLIEDTRIQFAGGFLLPHLAHITIKCSLSRFLLWLSELFCAMWDSVLEISSQGIFKSTGLDSQM